MSYKIPPDLRPWCEATAPNLTTEDWADCHRLVKSEWSKGVWLDGAEEYVTADQARALLAYAEDVAAGLTPSQRAWLTVVCEAETASTDRVRTRVFHNLFDKGLVARGDGIVIRIARYSSYFATDYGRYVAGRAAELRGER